jgi:fibronectin type 3 domain-containing protein
MSLVSYVGVTQSFFSDNEDSSDDRLGIRWGYYTINDGFENTGNPAWDDKWDDNGITGWVQGSTKPNTGIYDAYSDWNNNGYLISDDIDASTADNITVTFYYNLYKIEAGDIYVQTFNGTHYNNWYDLHTYNPGYQNKKWHLFNEVLTDPQYLIAGFRLRFDTTGLTEDKDEVNIDDVIITTDTIPPENPTGLVASGGQEQIDLDWNDNTDDDIWTYNVYRSLTSGMGYTKINSSPVYGSEYIDSNLYGGGEYFYVVTALDYGNNESGYSNEDSGIATNAPPQAPTGLIVSGGDETADLSWTANVETDIDYYDVYRSTANGSGYVKINTGGPVYTTNFTDTLIYGGGTFYYSLKATDTVNLTSGFSDAAIADVSNAPPSIPTGLVASGYGEYINLSWDVNIETDVTAYKVYCGTFPGGPYPNDLTPVPITSTEYTHSAIYGGGTYYYVIKAVDSGNLLSENSIEAGATATNVAPSPPSGLIAFGGDEYIEVSWTPGPETDVIGWDIYRKPDVGSYALIESGWGSSTYTDDLLFGGGTYSYKVRAVDASLTSSDSNEDTATATNAPPSKPTINSAIGGSENITIYWTDNEETDIAGYNVYRADVAGGPYDTKINGSLLTGNTTTDVDLYGGNTYYYIVQAVDTGNLSSVNSDEVSAAAIDIPPSIPKNLTAVALAGEAQILLNWDANNETDGIYYNVYRSISSGGIYTQIASPVYTCTYTDIEAYGGIEYFYVISATDSGNNTSGFSNEDSAVPNDFIPPVTTGLVATPGDGLAYLSWDQTSINDFAGYNVYRKTQTGNYTKIENLWLTANYTNTNLTGGQTYYYMVTVVDIGSNESGFSNEASVTPIDNPPSAPTNLSAVRGCQTVLLDWDDNTEGDLAGYNLYRGETDGGPYPDKVNGGTLIPAGTSGYLDTGLTAGVTYYYVVEAVDAGSNISPLSNQASATPWAPYEWRITAQSDFENGVYTDVSPSRIPGSVVLNAGGNAGGANMILLWDGGSAPSGWTVVSDAGGDFYQRFLRGSDTYGGTGGSATHTHNPSFSIPSSSNGTVPVQDKGGSGTGVIPSHTHTLVTSDVSEDSHLPLYRDLQVIKYDSGVPTIIPAGAIAVFDTTLPSGWTNCSDQDGRFVRTDATAGGTGGNPNHSHTVTIVTDVTPDTSVLKTGGSTQYAADIHTHSASESTSAIDNDPPYITVVLAKADIDTPIPGGMIAMFDAIPSGNWNVVSDSSGSFYERFIKGNNSYGITGGTASHSHGNQVVTLSGPSDIMSNGKNTKSTFASHNHIHTVDVTAYDSVSNLPPYIDVIFAKALYYATGTIASDVEDTGYAGSEWAELQWDASLPTGTNITFEVRASDTSFTKDDVTISWISVGDVSPISSGLPSGRYKQWRAILTSDGTFTNTPILQEVRAYLQNS